MDGKWSKSEAHLSRCVIAKVKFERLNYDYGYGYAVTPGIAEISLGLLYVYDHQRHLLTTTSLQIGIVYQLLCYSMYCTCYAVCVLYVPVTTQRSNQATLKARPGLKPASLVQIELNNHA